MQGSALQRANNQDAMENFQHGPPMGDPVDDVIAYWWSMQPDPHWKDLAQMVLEYLSIPATSAKPEQVFSMAKLTLRTSVAGWVMMQLMCWNV